MATNEKKSVKEIKIPSKRYYGTGKRKSAIAKVWIFEGKGDVVVNNQTLVGYFDDALVGKSVLKPFDVLKITNKYNCVIKTYGGGIRGQITAAQLGISRALLELNPEFRKNLKEHGLLTRDPRVKERKKYGRKKARKGYQFRKR